MDLHPIFVHFPVALITLFAVLEILPLEKKFGMPYVFTKFAFLLLGVLMSIPAYITGGIVGEAMERGPLRDVVELHSTFATATIVVAAVLFVLYLIRFGLLYSETMIGRSVVKILPQKLLYALRPLVVRGVVVILSLVLLLLITGTGALGGSMVYGANIDPIATFLYKLFGLPL